MSFRIGLSFVTLPPRSDEMFAVSTMRLFARVRFKTWKGYTRGFRAIVDTGAPVSLIPFKVWGQCAVTLLGERTVPTISERPECDLRASVGRVTLRLFDDVAESPDLPLYADLCHTSEMPLILGFKDFLEQGVLHCDYPGQEAWFEQP